MSDLAKRLELRLDEKRLKLLQEEARRAHVSIAELIRRAIDRCYQSKDTRVRRKLQAVKQMGKINAPVSDWQEMEDEIIKGMLK